MRFVCISEVHMDVFVFTDGLIYVDLVCLNEHMGNIFQCTVVVDLCTALEGHATGPRDCVFHSNPHFFGYSLRAPPSPGVLSSLGK